MGEEEVLTETEGVVVLEEATAVVEGFSEGVLGFTGVREEDMMLKNNDIVYVDEDDGKG